MSARVEAMFTVASGPWGMFLSPTVACTVALDCSWEESEHISEILPSPSFSVAWDICTPQPTYTWQWALTI